MKIKRMNGNAIPAKEHGASTLFITLILLLLSSLVVFYTARNAINEQRLSANEVRTKQAHDAASAGLDYAWLILPKVSDMVSLPFRRRAVLFKYESPQLLPIGILQPCDVMARLERIHLIARTR